MPNTLSTTWVKNVYSLRIGGGITSGVSYTVIAILVSLSHLVVHKLSNLSRLIPVFPTQLYPSFSGQSPLLNSQLYPLSTPPTITETKED